MSAIQTLIDEGVLVLWHDYRSGHADDLSGQGNDGTPSGVVWNREGARFSAGSQKITAASAIGGAAARSAVILHRPQSEGATSGRMLDDGKMIFYFSGSNGVFVLTSDTFGTTVISISYPGFGSLNCYGFSRDAAGAAILYANGVALNSGATGTPIAGTTDSVIGSNAAGTKALEGNVLAVVVASRVLTPTEHAAIYAELLSMHWPQKIDRAATAYGAAATQLQWGTDWGTPVTEDRTAGQRVGPFEIISGTHKVVTDTIEGKICKAIECVVSGVDSISGGAMRQTPDEMAYGTWDWWEYTPAIAVSNFGIVCQNPIKAVAGDIQMQMNGGTALAHLQNPATATIVGSMPFTPDQWNNWRITRSAANVFVVYLNGAQMGTATYAGVTSGKYSTVDQDTGCKRSLADVGAGHSMLKCQGVVAP